MTWLRSYAADARLTLRAAGAYLRDGDERALDQRIDVALERDPFRRLVKAATLAAYLMGRAIGELTPVVKRAAQAAVDWHAALEQAD